MESLKTTLVETKPLLKFPYQHLTSIPGGEAVVANGSGSAKRILHKMCTGVGVSSKVVLFKTSLFKVFGLILK